MTIDKNFSLLKKKRIMILYSEPGVWTEEEQNISLDEIKKMEDGLASLGLKVSHMKVGTDNLDDLDKLDQKKIIVLNWCEGFGDDDFDYFTVPNKLDELGITYTGGSPESLRLTADKEETKQVLINAKVPTPKSKIYHGQDANGWKKFPALVKPSKEHCSYGITRDSVVDDSRQLHKRVDEMLLTHGNGVMVEDFIEGAEYNVAVWGNDQLEVLPIGMIDYSGFEDYHDRLCGYEAKWITGSEQWNKTLVVCPAPMSDTLRKRVEKVALDTYRACGLRDYARVDIRVRGDKPYVLDVNANPDITIEGGFARSASRAGYSYGEAIAKILCLSLDREQKFAKVKKDEVSMAPASSVRLNVAFVGNASAFGHVDDWD